MGEKLIPRVTHPDGEIFAYSFYCPACKCLHSFVTVGNPPIWTFDGNMDAPSFSPSIRIVSTGCHLYVLSGQINYCNDCRHEFRGQVVPLVDLDLERGCPVDTPDTLNGQPAPASDEKTTVAEPQQPATSPTPAVKQVHRDECGIVGEVGEVGDLGSNAKQ